MSGKTAIYDIHTQLGAKIVDFHGWIMPIQYSGIIDEHNTVRQKAGLFDLSHMGEIEVRGVEAKKFLNYLTCNSMDKLSYDGKIIYTGLLNQHGGFIDDLLIYRRTQTDYLLVVNASNADTDFDWLKRHAQSFDVELNNVSAQTALTAVQGPLSAHIMERVTGMDLSGLYYYHFTEHTIDGKPVLISRTGYTGEDGFEVYSHWDDQPAIWDIIWDEANPAGAKPIGLGARDTLRLEMGYPLHGNDIDPETTPLEAGLGWIADLSHDAFIGKEKLVAQKENGIAKKLISFTMRDRGIPRQGYEIFSNGSLVGTVTSGTMSPSLKVGIGMGYVDPKSAERDDVSILIHGKHKRIALHKGAFVESKTYRK